MVGSRGVLEHHSLQTLYIVKLCEHIGVTEVKGMILKSKLHQTCINTSTQPPSYFQALFP